MTVRYRRQVSRSPVSDPQRNLLYRMEYEALGARGYEGLTRADVRQFARGTCRSLGVPQAVIRFSDIGAWSGEYGEGVVTLNHKRKGALCLLTIAHELGHHVHCALAPENDHEPHGPQFLAAYMAVLDNGRVLPVVGMRAILDFYKLRYHDPGTKNNLTALKRAVTRPS